MIDKGFTKGVTWGSLLLGSGKLVRHYYLSKSPEDTRILAAAFGHVACRSNRIRPDFRLGTQGRGGMFDSSNLGASVFVEGFLNGFADFSKFLKSDFSQSVGYSRNYGVVTVTDNKAGWRYPWLVEAAGTLSPRSLVVEEHGNYGKRKFDAYIPFWLHKNGSDRVIGIYVKKDLAETKGYKRFSAEVSHMRHGG